MTRPPIEIHQPIDAYTLPYLLAKPAASHAEPHPLIIFLHGIGRRGDDPRMLTDIGPMTYRATGADFPFLVIQPQCPETDIWWTALERLKATINVVMAAHPVDQTRIYLTGNSMGGYGTWLWLAAESELFAAAAPICGGGAPFSIKYMATMPPVWAFHGDADDAVPVSESQRMVDVYRDVGGDARLTIYPGVGHDSWTPTYSNPELYTWFLSQRRAP